MNRIIRFYNQNRRSIWIILFTIVLAFSIIRALNSYAKNSKEKSSSSNTTTYSAIYDNPNYPVIEGDTPNENKMQNITYVIDSFIKCCNEGKIEQAYNLLSNDCKNYLFKTQEEFTQKYYNIYFKTKKSYSYQAWMTDINRNTYRIELSEDLLSTGNTNPKKTEEYFTVVRENENYKLNINKYIGHEEIYKEKTQNNIKITAVSKDIYLDNVRYNFKVENFSANDIILDTLEKNNSTIIADSNDLKYIAATWEMSEEELLVYKGFSKNITIKFLREYKPEYKEQTIIFNAINLKYGLGKNMVSMEIEL